MEHLFVYGTLRKDCDHPMSQFLNAHSEWVNKGHFYGLLYDIGEYPGAILSANTTEKIFGDIYKINDSYTLFKTLDAYEGTGDFFAKPNLYIRKLITVFTENGLEIKAWIYIYNRSIENLKLISSGDYTNITY